MKFNAQDLEQRYRDYTASATAQCTFVRDMTGGQPASDDGIKAYIEHQMGITDPEKAAAILAQIKGHEIQMEHVNGEELDEQQVYNLNIVRKDEFGPWVGDWMAKACLKAAASRIGLWKSKPGAKGDMAEMGEIAAVGISLLSVPWHIYLRNADGTGPAETWFDVLRGRVSTPHGMKSIMTSVEKVRAGARFAFRLRYVPGRITMDDMASIFAAAGHIGLGSAKSFECGRFRVDDLEIIDETTRHAVQPKKVKKEKGAKPEPESASEAEADEES
jgi:hypothetical protein